MSESNLPPLPPNMGVMNYPLTVPIIHIEDAIKRWEKGERPTEEHRKDWPGLCEKIDTFNP